MSTRPTLMETSENTERRGEADQETPSEELTISKDDAFHVLQNARRRAVLRFLLDNDERDSFRMRNIAEEVAAWEHDTTVRQLSSDERQRVYIALYQSHLPKLDDYGIITYDQSRGVVEPTGLTPIFDPYLEDGLHADADLTFAEDSNSGDHPRSEITQAVTTLLKR